MKKTLLALVTVSILFSCASPRLTNWDRGNYSYYDYNGNLHKKNEHKATSISKPLNHPVIDVSVAVIEIPVEPEKKTEKKVTQFTDLSEKAQLELIKKFSKDKNSNNTIIEALKAQYSLETAKPETQKNKLKDYTEIKLHLFFSNVKKYYNDSRLMHPNTRLAFLNTSIKLQNANFTFKSIDKIQNEFETIDMGKLERSQDVTFNSNVSGDVTAKSIIDNKTDNSTDNSNTNSTTNSDDEDNQTKNETIVNKKSSKTSSKNTELGKQAKGEIALEMKNSIKEAVNVNFNRLKTGFSLNKNCLIISQQGSLLRDVNDVTIVTATFQFNQNLVSKNEVYDFSNLYNDVGVINKLSDVKVNKSVIKYYPCYKKGIDDQKITYSYEGAIRAPKNLKRGQNILEYDDKVNYFAFNSKCLDPKDCKDNPIAVDETIELNKFTFCKQVFRIKMVELKEGKKVELPIELSIEGDSFIPYFETIQAYNFLNWLNEVKSMKDKTKTKKIFNSKNFNLMVNTKNLADYDLENFDFEIEDVDAS